VNYHTLKLPRERIKMIDNRREFEEFFDNVLKDITMIGIDLEWKPSFGNGPNFYERETQLQCAIFII